MRGKAILYVLAALFALATLAGCGAIGKTPTPALPTVVLDQSSPPTGSSGAAPSGGSSSRGGVTASGVVAPAEQAHMAFATSGQVKSVAAAVGDQAKEGQVLVTLEGQENLEAAISAARYELALAEQALADLTSQAETARVQAMQDIVTYEQAVRNARYTLDNFTIPSNQANLDAVEAIVRMKERLDAARAAFEPYKTKASSDALRRDRKTALDNAQADYNTAVKRLQHEYDLEVAQTRLEKAQRDYQLLKQGPDPEKVRLAEARRSNAQTQLAAAQAALENLTLTAPFAGTVSQVNYHRGEWVVAGQPVLVLADLANLRVETTDLSERDVPQVKPGQAVTVLVKALNQEVSGRVSAIAPLAGTLGGDVVYQTTIILDTLPAGLRAGMSVEVQFETGG